MTQERTRRAERAELGSASAPRSESRGHEPFRFRLRVPREDTSVAEWWAAQVNPSASVRALIREDIERHGYTDLTSRPVTQQPRRGRPPLQALSESVADAHPEISHQSNPEPQVRREPGTIREIATVAQISEPAIPTEQPISQPVALQKNPDPEQSAVHIDPQSSGDQFDMEDIFGHGV